MVNYLIPLLIVALMAGGCRKKHSTETASPSEAPPPAPEAPAAPAQPSAPTPREAPATTRVATVEDIAAYNRNLSSWINVHDDVPKDLEDLKKRQGLPPLPTPPPGRQITYVPRFDRPTWSTIRME